MSEPYDFVAIGDTVTDAFIRLHEASVHCDINRERCVICMRFADKIPYDAVWVVPAVGNSANAAVAASRLGLSSALVANVGDDRHGEECLAALAAEGVGIEFVCVNPGKRTNYHYVLWYEDDRTILIKHELYDYTLPEIGSPRWLYLSSLAANSLPFHTALEAYLAAHPEVKLAFQPGTYQMQFGASALAAIYSKSALCVCNVEEARHILGTNEDDIRKLLDGMTALGPDIVAITDGIRGAYAAAGGRAWFMPPYPDPKPPLERTGAGDAFSATFAIALALGLDISEALRWAPVNSMSVVQDVGARAGLLGRGDLEGYLARAPAGYAPRELT